jgi:hypothetical protein
MCASVAWIATRSSEENPAAAPEPVVRKAGGSERARVIRQLHERRGEEALVLMEERARTDPTTARILGNATRDSVWKIKSLSEEEKVLLWERIQAAQKRVNKKP